MIFRDVVPPKNTSGRRPRLLVLPEKLFGPQANRARNLIILISTACVILLVFTAIHVGVRGLGMKREVVNAASAGFGQIIAGAGALRESHFETAREFFKIAAADFKNLEHETWFVSANSGAIPLPLAQAGSSILNMGRDLAQAGARFTDAAEKLNELPGFFFAGNRQPYTSGLPSLTEKLKKELPNIEEVSRLLVAANTEIQSVPVSLIPRDLSDRFRFAKEALGTLAETLKNLKNDTPALLTMLGDKEPHTFLILLQNNAELRPTGGFIGNYIIAETNDGYLTRSEVIDVYKADRELVDIIDPPEEIKPVSPRWFLRDSNFSAHFPLSAQKAAWFLEKENGPGVDTVIAVDLSLAVDFLRLTGPLNLPELKQSLGADNFSTVMSYYVESKTGGQKNPKSIVKSFWEKLQSELFQKTDPVALLNLLRTAASSKHLLAYSKNVQVQSFFEEQGVAGLMKTPGPKEDFLNIAHTSIGGNKSDRFITEKIAHDTFIAESGQITDELTLTRTHRWDDEVERNIRRTVAAFGFTKVSDNVMNILGRTPNREMLRIYVPSGSVLESSSDDTVTARVDEDTHKTYFLVRMDVPASQSLSLRLRYRLPFQMNLDPADKYRLTIQKQAGQDDIFFEKRISPGLGVFGYKYFPEGGSIGSGGIKEGRVWELKGKLDRDMNFAGVVGESSFWQ